jgi:putative aldouronate transport system substrate-binding protein
MYLPFPAEIFCKGRHDRFFKGVTPVDLQKPVYQIQLLIILGGVKMSKIAKRLASWVLVTGIAITSLVGCTKDSTKETGNSTADAQSTDQGPVKIDWLAYQTLAEPDPNSYIAQVIEKKFNAKFNYWFIDDSKWDDVLNVKLASGEMPDVMLIKDRNNIPKYVNQGVLAEIPDSSIQKTAPNYVKMANKYDPTGMIFNATKYNGKNYGFTTIGLNGSYPNVVIWRSDWLKNVGISKVPETLTEYEAAIYKFRNEDPDKNGKKDTYGISNTAFGGVFGAYGIRQPVDFPTTNAKDAKVMLKDGKIVYNAIQPEAKEALATLQKWYKDGVIDPEFVTGEHTSGYWATSQAFINGKIGVTGLGQFYHYTTPLYDGDKGSVNYLELQKANPNAAMEPGKAPVGPTGKSGTTASGVLATSFGITAKGAKNARIVDTALKMLDAVYSDDKDYAVLNTYGQKDIDYVINKDGIYTAPPDKPAGTPAESRKKGILIFTYCATNPDIQKQFNPPSSAYADKYYKFPSYVDPVVPQTDVASKYSETLVKLATEAYIKIISGEKPISYFDDFVKQFRAAGGDEGEKAMTDAYNKMIGK